MTVRIRIKIGPIPLRKPRNAMQMLFAAPRSPERKAPPVPESTAQFDGRQSLFTGLSTGEQRVCLAATECRFRADSFPRRVIQFPHNGKGTGRWHEVLQRNDILGFGVRHCADARDHVRIAHE